jgi:3-oxoacyl-[acyl-carrier protein] reductase
VSGQAIGIGGDRLSMWSHPAEVAFALHEGGWTPEAIAESWSATVGAAAQTYGVQLPPLELDEPAAQSRG